MLGLGDEVRTQRKKKLNEDEQLRKLADSLVADDPHEQMRVHMMQRVVQKMREAEAANENEATSLTSPKSPPEEEWVVGLA